MLTLVFHEALSLAAICCDPYLPQHSLVLQEDDLAVATVSLWSSLAPVAGHHGSPLHPHTAARTMLRAQSVWLWLMYHVLSSDGV